MHLSGVLPNNSNNESAPSFGSGIVGHFKNYVAVINKARNNEIYESKFIYEQNCKKNKKENYKFDIRQNLLDEIKYCLHFYSKFGLIKNKNFINLSDDEINKLTISNEKDSIELVFFLGNYNSNDCFENYLGIGNKNSSYSVKDLLNNEKEDAIDLDYINYDELFDFKVCKEKKNFNDSGFNLEIENYDTVYKKYFNK